jgi:hypothetical protein
MAHEAHRLAPTIVWTKLADKTLGFGGVMAGLIEYLEAWPAGQLPVLAGDVWIHRGGEVSEPAFQQFFRCPWLHQDGHLQHRLVECVWLDHARHHTPLVR